MSTIEELVGFSGLKNLKVADLKRGDALIGALSDKAGTLDPQRFTDQMLEQKVYLLIDLLRETLSGRYNELSLLAFAHIITALDYFLVVDDEVPDNEPGGYEDDLKAIVKVMSEFADEIKRFKEWKLKQVAKSWVNP